MKLLTNIALKYHPGTAVEPQYPVYVFAGICGSLKLPFIIAALFAGEGAPPINDIVGDPVVFSGTAIADSGISIETIYWILETPTSTTFTLTAEKDGTTEIDITSNGTGSMTVTYAYDEESCRRDAVAYINALIHDLNNVGNYWAVRAAVQYVNAVDGTELSNMFFVGNGTGLRNTLD